MLERSRSKLRRAATLVSLASALAIAACADPQAPATSTGASGGAGGALTGANASSTSSSSPAATSGSGGATNASSSASTSKASASSSASSSSSSSGANGGGGAACMNSDPGEPNDTEDTAYDFGPSDCSDSNDGMVYGVLADGEDVDWFTYAPADLSTCEVNPTHTFSVENGSNAECCVYFECQTGAQNTELNGCPSGTTMDTSPDGRPGCCGGPGTFTFDVDCGSVLDDWSLYIYYKVDDPTHTAACSTYSIEFHD